MNAICHISSTLIEQRIASADIAKKVELIAQMSVESSATVSEVSSAAIKLEKLAEELQQEVAHFKV